MILQCAISYFIFANKNSSNCRKLCIEALVEEGDRDKDWRLTIGEFMNLMDPEYQPSSKCKYSKISYGF